MYLIQSLVLWFLILAYGAEAAPSAQEILAKADLVRNPSESFLMEVTVMDHDGSSSRFKVKTLGKDRTLITTLSAPHSKTSSMLMINQDMWAYITNLKRSVRISLQQKLTGQAANGDIARMRLAGDYDARIESEDALHWVLFLAANKKGLTYEKIRLSVAKASFHPLKAEYLTLNGDTLKVASFENYGIIAGAARPKSIIIKDAKRLDQVSTIEITKLESADFPNSLFQPQNLEP